MTKMTTFSGHAACGGKKPLFEATEFFWVRGCLLLHYNLVYPDSYKMTTYWILAVNQTLNCIKKLAHLIIIITLEEILLRISNQALKVK